MIGTDSVGSHGPMTTVVQRVSLGPVSQEGILAMARLSGDFHPLRTLARVAKAAGHRELTLHPAWLSGLVHVGLKSASSAWRIVNLRIEYDAPAHERDVLSLELIVDESHTEGPERQVRFEVRNQYCHRLAYGTGVMNLVYRDPGKNKESYHYVRS